MGPTGMHSALRKRTGGPSEEDCTGEKQTEKWSASETKRESGGKRKKGNKRKRTGDWL